MSGRGYKRQNRGEFSPNESKRDKSNRPRHPPHLKGREIGLFYQQRQKKFDKTERSVSIIFSKNLLHTY